VTGKGIQKAKKAIVKKAKPTNVKATKPIKTKISPGERLRRMFTPEFKAKAVSAILNQNKRLTETAKKFGVGESNLREWIQTTVAKAVRDGSPISQEMRDRYALSSYLNSACVETMSILKAAKEPIPSSKLRLKGYKKATLYRALAFLKEMGDIVSKGDGRTILYELSKAKDAKAKSSNGVHVN
jgi:transposase-like protein